MKEFLQSRAQMLVMVVMLFVLGLVYFSADAASTAIRLSQISTVGSTAGQAIKSNGAGVAPTWGSIAATGAVQYDISQSLTTAQKAQARANSGSDLNTFNPRNYGAVCDGTTDDTLEFQAAIAAAELAGFGTVIVPPSQNGCMISSTLNITKDRISMIGEGLGTSRIKIKTPFTGTAMLRVARTAGFITSLGPIEKITLKDFAIEGNTVTSTNVDCFHIKSYQSRLINLFADSCSGNGIHLSGYYIPDGDPVGWSNYDSVLDNAMTARNTLSGIFMDHNATDFYIKTPHSFANSRDGIEIVAGTSAVNILGGHLYDNQRYGVSATGGHVYGSLTDMEIETSGQRAFTLISDATSGSSGWIIKGNRFWRNTAAQSGIQSDIWLQDGTGTFKAHYEINFTGNYIEGSTGKSQYGLRLDGNVQLSNFSDNIFSQGTFITAACFGTGTGNPALANRFSNNSVNCTP
jgi:Pectate lyase superfamily protein